MFKAAHALAHDMLVQCVRHDREGAWPVVLLAEMLQVAKPRLVDRLDNRPLAFKLRRHVFARHQIDFGTAGPQRSGPLSRSRLSRRHFLALSLPGFIENDWAIGKNAASYLCCHLSISFSEQPGCSSRPGEFLCELQLCLCGRGISNGALNRGNF